MNFILDETTASGDSLIHVAVRRKFAKLIEFLISVGVDINLKNKQVTKKMKEKKKRRKKQEKKEKKCLTFSIFCL